MTESNDLKHPSLHTNHISDDKEDANVGVNDKNVGVNVGVKLNKTQRKIVELLKNNPNSTIEEMAKYAEVEPRTIERNIKALKEKNVIDRVGADKNGHWIVKI